jgi:hypothetical protein
MNVFLLRVSKGGLKDRELKRAAKELRRKGEDVEGVEAEGVEVEGT